MGKPLYTICVLSFCCLSGSNGKTHVYVGDCHKKRCKNHRIYSSNWWSIKIAPQSSGKVTATGWWNAKVTEFKNPGALQLASWSHNLKTHLKSDYKNWSWRCNTCSPGGPYCWDYICILKDAKEQNHLIQGPPERHQKIKKIKNKKKDSLPNHHISFPRWSTSSFCFFLCPQHSKDKIRVPGTAKNFTAQGLEKGTSLCLTIWAFHGDPQEFFSSCVPDIPGIGLECPELQKKLSKKIIGSSFSKIRARLGVGG